jgi:thiamine biosynthesis lipoprotein
MASRFLASYGERAGSAAPVRRHERILMATWNVILLVERPGGPGGAALDRAARAAFALMEELEAELSRFVPESDVSLMNALAAGRPVAVSDALLELLGESRRYWELTRGAFDPTVGPLMRAWGFDAGRPRSPSDAEIAALLACRGMDRIRLDRERGTVSFDRPGVAFDAGAIGKGFIVGRAVERLREAGAAAGALLSGRSTIAVWGAAPDGGRWRVGVADPRSPDEAFLELLVAEGAVSTSAAYEKRLRIGGEDHGHVLDPRTGRPARGGPLSVTVWTPDPVRGDVASTALFVLGREEGEDVLEALAPISAVFLEEDSSAWGGLRAKVRHAPAGAAPGIEVVR